MNDLSELSEKELILFNLSFPDWNRIPTFLRINSNEFKSIIHHYSYKFINQEDIKIYNNELSINDINSNYLGNLFGILLSGTADTLRILDILFEFENKLKDIIPNEVSFSTYNMIKEHDNGLKNIEKVICEYFKRENELSRKNRIYNLNGYKIMDTYDILHNINNEDDILIGRFSPDHLFAIRDENNNIDSDILPFVIEYSDIKYLISYIKCISNLFHIDWRDCIFNTLMFRGSFRSMITGCYYNNNTIKVYINKIKNPCLLDLKNGYIKIITSNNSNLMPFIYEDKIIIPKLKSGHLLYFKRWVEFYDIGPYLFYRNLIPDNNNLEFALEIKLIDKTFYDFWKKNLEKPFYNEKEEITIHWKYTIDIINKMFYSYKYSIPRKIKQELSNNPLNFYLAIIGTIFSFMSVIQVIQGFIYN
jgi:hypothetical protein